VLDPSDCLPARSHIGPQPPPTPVS
jgi:hypothetical protein